MASQDDHPITVSGNPKEVSVLFEGRVIAKTSRALLLCEASYPAVNYISREDADMEFFEPSAHETLCPYKGTASYLTIRTPEGASENAVWSYEEPFEKVAEIKGYLAFYPDKVELVEE
jgi:uncharacterized protein (DUF427 family)